jgi:ribosomal protein S18 acetylase RimI-like enzyme
MTVTIRPLAPGDLGPEELARVGDLVVDAYRAAGALDRLDDYALVLRDVERRAREAVVLAAFDDRGRVLGCVTYVGDPTSPWAEHLRAGEASIRMLAVDRAAQGQGVGDQRTAACLARARAEGRTAMFLHSQPMQTAAHRLYERHGFVRAVDRDWHVDGLHLMAFTRAL